MKCQGSEAEKSVSAFLLAFLRSPHPASHVKVTHFI